MKQFLTLAIALFSIHSFSQTWTQNHDFNGGDRFGVSYFSLEGDAYLMGGLKQSGGGTYIAYDDLWRYDKVEDNWVPLADYPGGNRYGGFTFVIGDTVYIGLGANQFGTFSNTVWSYNTVDGWEEVASFPGHERVYPFAFSASGNGYVGGGSGAEFLADLWEYNAALDVWVSKADYPGGGRVGQVMFSIADKGYVGLGDDGSFYYNDFYSYNPEIDAWNALSDFDGENRSFAANTVVGDNGYMLGGEDFSGSYTNEMWQYNATDDVWSESHDFTDVSRRYGALYSIDDIFYYGVGQDGASDTDVRMDFWQYNGSIGIGEYLAEEGFALYPNPFRNQLNIILNSSSEIVNIKIYNNLMQTIYSGIDSSIDTESWDSSVYYIQIETSKGVINRKVIKI